MVFASEQMLFLQSVSFQSQIRSFIWKFFTDLEKLLITNDLKNEKIYMFLFQLVNFLSDIGGTLGLYAGVSLMTGIEFINLFFNLIQAAFSCLVSGAGTRNRNPSRDKANLALQQQSAA